MSTIQQRIDATLSEATAGFGGFLRCERCGARGQVKSRYWSTGWPTCCGYAMRWWTQRQIDAGEVPAA